MMNNITNINYAGIGDRLLAFLMDSIIIIVPLLALTQVTGLYKINREWTGVAINIFELILCWLYFTAFESSSWQATVGKKILNLKVTNKDNLKITFRQASVRFWSKLITLLTLGIGFLILAFNEKRQALHDKIAGCVILNKENIIQPLSNTTTQ